MELSDPEPITVGCGEEGRGLMRKTRVVSCQCAENMTLDLKPSGGSSQRTTGRRWGAPRRGGGEEGRWTSCLLAGPSRAVEMLCPTLSQDWDRMWEGLLRRA